MLNFSEISSVRDSVWAKGLSVLMMQGFLVLFPLIVVAFDPVEITRPVIIQSARERCLRLGSYAFLDVSIYQFENGEIRGTSSPTNVGQC